MDKYIKINIEIIRFNVANGINNNMPSDITPIKMNNKLSIIALKNITIAKERNE